MDKSINITNNGFRLTYIFYAKFEDFTNHNEYIDYLISTNVLIFLSAFVFYI